MPTSSCSSPTTSARRTRTGCGAAISTSTRRRSRFDYRGRKFLVGTSKECRLWLLDRDDARRRGSSDDALHDAAHLQRRAGVRRAEASGARSARGRTRAARVGAGAVLGTGEQGVQGAGRARPARRAAAWRRSSWKQRAGKWQLDAGVAVARHGSRRRSRHRQRRRLRLRGRRGCDAGRCRIAAWNEPGGPVYGGGLSSGPGAPHSQRHATPRSTRSTAQTGKELWSSGNQIESWNHFSGLTVANGRAYIATFDGVLYCFGVAEVGGVATLMRLHAFARSFCVACRADGERRVRPDRAAAASQWLTAFGDAQRTSWIRDGRQDLRRDHVEARLRAAVEGEAR